MRSLYSLLLLIAALAVSETASSQDWNSLTYSADAPGIDQNPLRGIIPYVFAPQSSFPHSMEWFYVPLSDVVVGQGKYDWKPVDRQLETIASRGDQAAFRFYLDFPGKRSAIPRYLLAAGLKTYPYRDFENATSKIKSRAPDQSDPRLLQCLVDFIHALGERYDGDPRIGYLTAGLVGFWGEWHVNHHPLPGEPAGWAMPQAGKDAILTAYRDSFHKTFVLVRYPNATPQADLQAAFGLHDDSLFNDTLGPEAWHFMTQMTVANALDNWQTHATGGEIYPELQAQLWDAWPNPVGQDVATVIAATHLTWMLDETLYQPPPTPEQKANALRADRSMGYTLFCSGSRIVRNPDGSATISVRIENRGIAPFYAPWPVELEAIQAGEVLAQAKADWPLSTLLPGQEATYDAQIPNMPAEPAAIVMRIVNPLPNGHPVAFANAEMDTVKPGWLTLLP